MVVLHAFLALLAGFATMAAVVMVITMLLARLTPEWAGVAGPPHRGYILVVLGYSYLAAAGGGYVTAWLAQAHPLEHVLTLGIVVLLLSGLSAMLAKSDQPTLYQVALVAIMPVGVLAGGIVRMKVLGIL
jgi:uncharacterized membrane protein